MADTRIIDELLRIGRAKGVSITAITHRMGYSPSYLYKLRDGSREPGWPFVMKACYAFPEMKLFVINIILDENDGTGISEAP
jgi:hypothetical protein